MGLPDVGVVEAILAEQQDITPELALRLSRVFQTTPELWLRLQGGHDLSKTAMARREELAQVQPLVARAA